MACILEELKKTLTKQLGNTKNSKEFKDGSTKAKERVAILSTLLNNVTDMKKAAKNNTQKKVELVNPIEEPEKDLNEIAAEVLAKKHKNLAYGKDIERLSNAKPSTVQDILIKELAKLETDIIAPTETFEKNVNRKIECKE